MNLVRDQLGLTISEDIVPARPVISSSIVSNSFGGLLNPPLELQTNQTQCGGQLWPAGMVLAEYLLREKLDDLRGKTILELGAGSGLVGSVCTQSHEERFKRLIVISLAVALGLHQSEPEKSPSHTEILLTDGLSTLIPLLQQNIDLNLSASATGAVSAKAEYFSWGQAPGSSVTQPDFILAADCAYLEETFPLLVKSLQDTMGERTVLLFCYKRRRKRDKDCVKLVGKVFDVQTIKGEWERESVFLYAIRSKLPRSSN